MTKRKTLRQFRQGDVFVIEDDTAVRGMKAEPLEGGRIVLAHGEATGHAHAILPTHAKLYRSKAGERHLRIVRETELFHEEHAPIKLPPGNWKVIRQREYSPERNRYVAD